MFLCILTFIPFIECVNAEEGDSDEIIHSTFYVITTQETRTLDVPFNKNWFKQDATVYNHDLCKLSIGLATAAFRPKVGEENESMADTNLRNFLEEAHFSGLRSDDYEKNPGMYTVSTVMGHQKIGEGDEAFELIAVGICGQGYLDEWESNFSIGDGQIHNGFEHSAKLVYDRIFGYIASNALEGRCKIWLSGFSRAAAISNITAARLSDTEFFDEKDVFAYTFATPRTVIDTDFARYKNIFNIVGKADPVPCVPYADWGYERYGNTLFLPAMETDSDFEEKRVRANEIYKNLTGIDYWYNRDANNMLRDILGYALEISPTVQVYAHSLQNNMIGLWEDRSPINVMSRVLQMANDPLLINEENRNEANMLLDYLIRFILDYFDSRSLFRRWNNSASLGANILQAHTPELYVSWLYSADSGEVLYNQSERYTLLVVDYAKNVSLYTRGKLIETLPGVTVSDEKGDVKVLIEKDDREVPDEYVYMEYLDDSVVVQVPRDLEYTVTAEAEEGSTLVWVKADYASGRQAPLSSTLNGYTFPTEDTMSIHLNPDMTESVESIKGMGDYLISDNSDEPISHTIILTNPKTATTSWRDAAMIAIGVIFTVIALIIFQIVYLIGKLRHAHRIRSGWLPKGTKYSAIPILCVTFIYVLYAIMQFNFQLFPDDPAIITTLKIEIALLSVGVAAVGFLKRRNRLTGFITIGLILLGIADAVTSHSVAFGAILHICAYGVLTYAYMKEEMLGKRRIIAWVLCLLIGIAALMGIPGTYGVYRFLAMIYLAAALAMVISSLVLPRRVFIGSLFLFLAGVLLIHNQIHGLTFISHAVSLGVYYTAIATLAISNTQIIMPRLIPEAEAEN